MKEKTKIDPSVVIHRTSWVNPYNVTIGKNVQIGPFCSIGCDGFQVNREKMEIVPHKGQIIIEDNVEILSHCDIDLGLNKDDITLIGENCKLGHYVHISHGDKLGKNTLIAAHTNLNGSVEIGENCYIHPGVIIAANVKIGDNVLITIGSVVTKNIESDKKVSGFWAIDHEKWANFKISKIEIFVGARARLKSYLEYDEEREKIARRGYETVMKYHTNDVRARQFLNFLEENQ